MENRGTEGSGEWNGKGREGAGVVVVVLGGGPPCIRELSCGKLSHTQTYTHAGDDHNTCSASLLLYIGAQL